MESTPHVMLMTIVVAIFAGVMLIVLSRQLKMPAIALLLLGGIGLGPQGLGLAQPESLGGTLQVFVSLAVGIILFEGGLTLNLGGYRAASNVIRRLLSIGVVTTWLCTTLAIYIVFAKDASYALLAASLVIVTGPTVIGPLLKRIRVQENLHNILHWEGVLIDAIGVFITVLCFEWFTFEHGGMAVANFALRIISGIGIGSAGGFILYLIIRLSLVPADVVNVFTLGAAALIFGIADSVISESGVLAVTVAGLLLGAKNLSELRQIKQFKAEITDLLIGMLFILLAARLKFDQFETFGQRGAILVALVVFVIRPLNVLVSTRKCGLNWREKVFLCWVAPRGIVAASMASLISLKLQQQGTISDPRFIETFTFSVIMTTVLLQGFTAGPLAAILRVKRPVPNGWLIVGAHNFGRQIAKFIANTSKFPVLVVDTNPKAVAQSRDEGLTAIHADARETSLEERAEFQGIGNLLALTDNEDLNELLCERWSGAMDREHLFRWCSTRTEDQRNAHGRVVFPELPKPSLISAELQHNEASLFAIAADKALTSSYGIVLSEFDGSTLQFDPHLRQSDPKRDRISLWLRRDADYLLRSLSAELVIEIDAESKEVLFSKLLDAILVKAPNIKRAAAVSQLIDREKSFPTSIGHGIAVPHTYCAEIPARICAIARLKTPIDFEAADKLPVNTVFLLLSPPGDPEAHIATIAEIARLVADANAREKLLNAQTSALINTLRDLLGAASKPAA